jgi:hypothetical protein
MTALAHAPEIVSSSFLDHCLQNKSIPTGKELEKFRLQDLSGEQTYLYGLKLQDALDRASLNNRKLLKDWQIFVTPNIQGGIEIYKDAVETNGGKCFVFKDRMKVQVSKRGGRGDTQDESQQQRLFLVSGGGKADASLWKGFKDMAQGANMVPVIASSEWLLNVVMAQDVDVWKDEWQFS